MTQDERDKILNDPDYISSKRYKYSLKRFLKTQNRPAPDSRIASLLKMTVSEVEFWYKSAVATYQDHLDI